MNCERYSEWISEAIDGTLTPAQHAELDAHCRGCGACRELLDDLKEIRAAAASLDRLTPSPEMWTAIAAQIHTPRATVTPMPTRQRRVIFGSRWMHVAAAAALVAMLGASAWFGLSMMSRRPANDRPAELARTAASELQLAEQHYLNAITSLEQLTVQKDNALDPAIAADIAASLKSIDRAIDDSRAALKADPRSFVAQTSLLEALRMKVALLQETVSLMNAS